jgi:flagellar basal-body rod protein FlgG
MIRALSTAATGLEAQQANVERISNDLANVNTDGYKRGRTEFYDLMYQTITEPGAAQGETTITPVGVQTGLGVRVGAQHKIFEQGPARTTYHPYDLMIEGPGFFPIQLPNGEVGYTRAGAFHLDAQGRMVTSFGGMLLPQITIPMNASSVQISPRGEVKAQFSDGQEAVLGQIQLVNFVNPEGLMAGGSGVYKPTLASGEPIQAIPGEAGLGVIQQGALEGSNVNVANSMVDLINTQRGYEMNSKVLSVADQMLGSLTNIK